MKNAINEFFAFLPNWVRGIIAIVVIVLVWGVLGLKVLASMVVGAVIMIVLLYRGGALSEEEIEKVSDWAIDFFRKHGDYPGKTDIIHHMKK